jgi:hypothetical protein
MRVARTAQFGAAERRASAMTPITAATAGVTTATIPHHGPYCLAFSAVVLHDCEDRGDEQRPRQTHESDPKVWVLG